uniref:Uncharacterized protein n=1 Tax=Lygus hesperus TaxID=30085 RepID=A0A0A9YTU0_LYGHE
MQVDNDDNERNHDYLYKCISCDDEDVDVDDQKADNRCAKKFYKQDSSSGNISKHRQTMTYNSSLGIKNSACLEQHFFRPDMHRAMCDAVTALYKLMPLVL